MRFFIRNYWHTNPNFYNFGYYWAGSLLTTVRYDELFENGLKARNLLTPGSNCCINPDTIFFWLNADFCVAATNSRRTQIRFSDWSNGVLSQMRVLAEEWAISPWNYHLSNKWPSKKTCGRHWFYRSNKSVKPNLEKGYCTLSVYNARDLPYELKLFNASHIAAKQMVLCPLSQDLCRLSHVAGFYAKIVAVGTRGKKTSLG